ncbi:Phytanoyl-CoA dioxygenase (PhyH) [Andreprevotia lacus DSM 23236]|uniref:Phytanoyl-CoA dioxygenase (PhyH) n=1 Tax=Andreprevotia lacus DSM 23236 TaxID=1121001 RepID=A0A1W1XXN3_9NEIS|nr:phytanoyl-CoA dioxygenase family protein [Andreprevotia lacus]SMC28693.1 Phytanoyl-CoA dioxygenase (PhyH) [Andreprevotia lacus DSM 23236]
MLAAALQQQGYAWLRDAVPVDQLAQLRALTAGHAPAAGQGGVRHIDRLLPEVAALARHGRLAALISGLLGTPSSLVRALLFDKSPQQNWLVSWHQDLTVTAAECFDAPGWGPWSQKDGAWHVRPPHDVLAQRLTLRVHLDDAGEDNGCLRVLPGSHLAVGGAVPDGEAVECVAAAGDVLLMSPLLWHASRKALQPAARRVLHFEYACHSCAAALGWQPLDENND